MAKKRAKKTYHYECTISGKKFVRTEKSETPDELVSVEAYYEMHQDEDDRPVHIKKAIEIKKAQDAELAQMFGASDDQENLEE